ncbi:MAG TPA: hypothetical protein VGH66_03190 [Acidimicrobiales bacterium]|jgi:hypothetical protein
MRDHWLGDHAVGVELQLEELIVRLERARREGWPDEVHALELEVAATQLELADIAEGTTEHPYAPVRLHGADTAERLTAGPRTA